MSQTRTWPTSRPTACPASSRSTIRYRWQTLPRNELARARCENLARIFFATDFAKFTLAHIGVEGSLRPRETLKSGLAFRFERIRLAAGEIYPAFNHTFRDRPLRWD